jgi:hypothetical protein
VAFAHDQGAVAHAEDLRQLRGDQQDPHAPRREVRDRCVNLLLRRTVDSACRLVEQEDAPARKEPFSRAPPSAGCRRSACAPAGRYRGAHVELAYFLATSALCRRRSSIPAGSWRRSSRGPCCLGSTGPGPGRRRSDPR